MDVTSPGWISEMYGYAFGASDVSARIFMAPLSVQAIRYEQRGKYAIIIAGNVYGQGWISEMYR